MAKTPISTVPLSLVEIVMRADAETIKAAYEARVKVDGLLDEREKAYRRIAELEGQIDSVLGGPGTFVFPDPPLPVAGFAVKAAQPKKPQPQQQPQPPKPAAEKKEEAVNKEEPKQ